MCNTKLRIRFLFAKISKLRFCHKENKNVESSTWRQDALAQMMKPAPWRLDMGRKKASSRRNFRIQLIN